MMLAALAQRPELLLLDEPTDGLDPVARRDILAALLEYVQGGTATVLISSHLVHELERICNWVGIMDGGRLAAEMPMERLKTGTKRLRVEGAPAGTPAAPPFLLLNRTATGNAETWVVRDWEAPMAAWFEAQGARLAAVQDLDLESGFVELLRAFRTRRMEA
jgi:ABC-2 type transport system ATP-binding protein